MRKRRRQTSTPKTEPNMTSMLDIMFVLLLTFMVVAPAINKGVELELPKVRAAETMKNAKPINLSVALESGVPKVFLDQQPTELANLVEALKAKGASDEKEPRPITLAADRSVPWETVAEIIADLRAAGMTSIGIMTDVEK
ncbi:MAG: biopolymer transporter ExbD [Candidatus Sumerlaeia bacterium]|nr:biopolymer transporter ExbD [Candidatus Sumerlaeia bacterium]